MSLPGPVFRAKAESSARADILVDFAQGFFDVVDIRLIGDVDPPMVTGTIRNNTSEEVDSAEVSYYLADGQGSLIGSESTVVRHVPPRGSVIFRAPLKMAKAEYVLVCEVHPN